MKQYLKINFISTIFLLACGFSSNSISAQAKKLNASDGKLFRIYLFDKTDRLFETFKTTVFKINSNLPKIDTNMIKKDWYSIDVKKIKDENSYTIILFGLNELKYELSAAIVDTVSNPSMPVFKIKTLPAPVFYVGKKEAKGAISKKELTDAGKLTVSAFLGKTSLKYMILSMECSFPTECGNAAGINAVNGGNFTKEVLDKINTASQNCNLYLDIKLRCPDGNTTYKNLKIQLK